jgi:hypothetical protein
MLPTILTDHHRTMLSYPRLSEPLSSAHRLVETTGPRMVAAWRGFSFAFYFYFLGFTFRRSLRPGPVRTM